MVICSYNYIIHSDWEKMNLNNTYRIHHISWWLPLVLLSLVSIGLITLFIQSKPISAVNALLGETFTNSYTKPNQWIYGGSACLTAGDQSTTASSIPACNNGPINTNGDGALRLTGNGKDDNGYAILNTTIPTAAGFRATFDMYQYNSSTDQPADGLAFLILDGSTNPSQDSIPLGGALGYGYYYTMEDGSTEVKGIDGGYAGIGFDVYGNYSLSNCGSGPNIDCSPRSPNTITVRGSSAAKYSKAASKVASGSLNVNTTDRNLAKRTVTVSVSTNQILTVTVDYNDGNGPVTEIENLNLTEINGGKSTPDTIKVGFSASTGYFTDIHEIKNLSLTTLEPDLTVGINAPLTAKAGSNINASITVANEANAGPLYDPSNVEIDIPDGMTTLSASGDGWVCNIAGKKVLCSNSVNSLQSGSIYPPINLSLALDKNTNGKLLLSAKVTTASTELSKDNNQASTTVMVEAPDDQYPNNENSNDTNITPPNTGLAYRY